MADIKTVLQCDKKPKLHKPSLISKISISSTVKPAAERAAGIAAAGPMPISSGCTPTTWKPRYAPRIGIPSSCAFERRIKRTAEAPSETCDALPAVVEPPFWNAGLSFASPAMVVPLRGPSSLSTTITCSSPLASSIVVVMGTISDLKYPIFCACKALL